MKKYRWIPFIAFLIWASLFLFAAEKITDGGMENWVGGHPSTDLTNWIEEVNGTSTIESEAVEIHGGTLSCKLTEDASGNMVQIYQAFTMTPSASETLTMWYYLPTGSTNIRISLVDSGFNVGLQSDGTWGAVGPITLSTTGSWTQYTRTFTAHASYTNYIFYIWSNTLTSCSAYIDDVSIDETESESFVPKIIFIRY